MKEAYCWRLRGSRRCECVRLWVSPLRYWEVSDLSYCFDFPHIPNATTWHVDERKYYIYCMDVCKDGLTYDNTRYIAHRTRVSHCSPAASSLPLDTNYFPWGTSHCTEGSMDGRAPAVVCISACPRESICVHQCGGKQSCHFKYLIK